MSELLLELFSEEIPARMQVRAAAELERSVNKALLDAGFMPEGVKAFSGPRRLTVVAAGIPSCQPDRREEKKGPRVGAPEKAVEGFLKSAGLSSLDDCEQREDKKGAYWVAVIDKKGRETAALIAEFVPEIVRGFSWAKSMRWGDGDMRWVRPLHRVLCVFDGEVVPFEIEGVASGDVTEGHRFMGAGDIQTRSFEAYERDLRAGNVLIDAEERKELIARDAETLCKAQGLELVEDQGLLNEVSGLAEWPVVMMGSFDEKFLTVPDEVLIASMRGHQKYFSVRDPKTGRLANKFIYVANLEAPDGGAAMRTGYERVLTARLSDGWYLYNQDLKRPLADRIEDLDKVTFFEGLGSVGDKARRIAALAKEIAPVVGADPAAAERAAMLAKADLVTGMVYEFPELQGVMGRYYHLVQSGAATLRDAPGGAPQGEGTRDDLHPEEAQSAVTKDEDQQIADAIRDHYKPAGQDDEVPTAPVSVAVALADKIDTLTAFWAIDKKPTGSSDPFALRRAALGVIQLVLEGRYRGRILNWVFFVFWQYTSINFDSGLGAKVTTGTLEEDRGPEGAVIDLFDVSHWASKYDFEDDDSRATCVNEMVLEGYYLLRLEDERMVPDDWDSNRVPFVRSFPSFNEDLLTFFHDRLKVYLRDKGHKHDRIEAVLTDASGQLQDDLVLVAAKLEALDAFLKTDDGANLAAAYKRAANILKAEEKKDKSRADPNIVAEVALAEAEEKALFAALKGAETKADKAVAEENFEDAMSALSALREPLDAFFEKVIVNADDAALRKNRLSLLARFRTATAKVADFSKLEG